MVVCGGKPDAILSVGTHYWKFNYWLDDDQRNCWLEPEYHAIHTTPSWKMYRAYYKVNTPLLHLFPTPQSHFKVHCTHKFTFTSLQFWKKKNSFPFVISNFPVAFFIFSLLFLALPPEWKLKVGKLIDFLRFPSVQKRRKAFMAWYTYWALLTIINQVQKKIFAFAEVVRWPPPPYFLPLE